MRTRFRKWTVLATGALVIAPICCVTGCEGLLGTADLSEREGDGGPPGTADDGGLAEATDDGAPKGDGEAGAASDAGNDAAEADVADVDVDAEDAARSPCADCPDSGCSSACIVRAMPPSTFLTGSFGSFGGDGYHINQAGELWHIGYNESGWSLVANAPKLAGGIARLTSTTASNFDAIVAAGADGNLHLFYTQAGSAYTWLDTSFSSADCDRVVGTPSVGSGEPATSNLGISFRCANGRIGSGANSGLPSSQWTWTFSQPPHGLASDVAEGFDTDIYFVGNDGLLYKCTPQEPNAPCAFVGGNGYPTSKLVGTPGVAYSQRELKRWVLVADAAGEIWAFDASNNNWAPVGYPQCGAADGEISAAVDSVHDVWIAAVRCTSETAIAVYSMSSGSLWTELEPITRFGAPLGRPIATAQQHLNPMVAPFETNVSFETSAGEQVVFWYVNGLQTSSRNQGFGTIGP